MAKRIPQYYAYLEWFDPFPAMPHVDHRFYRVKRTIANGCRVAAVVPIGHLQRSVHLFPAFNTNTEGEEWKSSDVLEKCLVFYLNSLSDRHAYHYFV